MKQTQSNIFFFLLKALEMVATNRKQKLKTLKMKNFTPGSLTPLYPVFATHQNKDEAQNGN